MAGKAPPRGLERLTDLPVAIAVRAAAAVVSRIGPRRAYSFARFLGSAWGRLIPRRRRIAIRNLEIAFRGELSPEKQKEIAHSSARHIMANAMDVFLRDRHVTPISWPRIISTGRGVEEIIRREHPRGLVYLSAHLGDWEMLTHFMALRGIQVTAVARSIHNPHLNRLATALRTSQGTSLVQKRGALHGVWKVLRAGGVAGLMTDQSAPQGESFEKFFGASASTYFQYARLLVRAKPDVVFIACIREGFNFRFRILMRDLSCTLDGPGEEDELAHKLVRNYLKALEELIRAYPEQYLWQHRRWKRRPPGSPDLYQHLKEPLDLQLLEPASPANSGEADPGARIQNGSRAE